MGDIGGGIGAGFIFAAAVFCLAVVVMWIVLPFAVFGTKPLIQQLIAEVRKTNELLRKAQGAAPEPPAEAPYREI